MFCITSLSQLVSTYKGVYYSPHVTDRKETKALRQSELPKILQTPEPVLLMMRQFCLLWA